MAANLIFPVLLVYLASCSFGDHHSNDSWFGVRKLDENYSMKWKTNHMTKVLTVRIEVNTRGWVGFGFSAHGKMIESDLVIGWINDQGQTFFNVRIL